MAKYRLSKLVELDKLAKKTGLNRSVFGAFSVEGKWAWLSRNYEAQKKYDGCSMYIVLTDVECWGFSRTGTPAKSMDAQIYNLWQDMLHITQESPGGLVIEAEAWWPGKDQFHQINGAFQTEKEQKPELHIKIRDVFTGEEFARGSSDIPYSARLGRVLSVCPTGFWSFVERYIPGSYGDPRELCQRLVRQGGYDGAVLVDPEAGWKLDDGKNGEKIKVKAVLSLDLLCLGYETTTGDKTGRPVYKVRVELNGKPVLVGSGVPHNLAELPEIGSIVEINCLGMTKDGALREPRYKGVRADKLEADA